MFLRLYFILYFLLISFQAFSLICQDNFSTGSVFVSFAQKQIGESWVDEMGIQWQQRITRATRYWSRKDARKFLNFLDNRIGIKDTIERIKFPSYLKNIRYQNFINRVSLYEEYIDESEVTIHLRKSFGGFSQGQIDEIRAVIEYVKIYIGEEDMKKRMEQDLLGFSKVKLLALKRIVRYMEMHIGTDLTKEKMKRDLESFSRFRLIQLKQWEKGLGVEALKDLFERYNFKHVLRLIN